MPELFPSRWKSCQRFICLCLRPFVLVFNVVLVFVGRTSTLFSGCSVTQTIFSGLHSLLCMYSMPSYCTRNSIYVPSLFLITLLPERRRLHDCLQYCICFTCVPCPCVVFISVLLNVAEGNYLSSSVRRLLCRPTLGRTAWHLCGVCFTPTAPGLSSVRKMLRFRHPTFSLHDMCVFNI